MLWRQSPFRGNAALREMDQKCPCDRGIILPLIFLCIFLFLLRHISVKKKSFDGPCRFAWKAFDGVHVQETAAHTKSCHLASDEFLSCRSEEWKLVPRYMYAYLCLMIRRCDHCVCILSIPIVTHYWILFIYTWILTHVLKQSAIFVIWCSDLGSSRTAHVRQWHIVAGVMIITVDLNGRFCFVFFTYRKSP